MLSERELAYLGQNSETASGHIIVAGENFELVYFSSPEFSTITIVSSERRLFLNDQGSIELSSKNTRIHYSGSRFSSTAFCTRLGLKNNELAKRLGFEPTSVFEIVCNFVGLPQISSLSQPVKSV
jgi:hypothetical protein